MVPAPELETSKTVAIASENSLSQDAMLASFVDPAPGIQICILLPSSDWRPHQVDQHLALLEQVAAGPIYLCGLLARGGPATCSVQEMG